MKNKIFYLHIPKCSGSTINKLFKDKIVKCKYIEHAESHLEKIELANGFSSYDYISGHITLPQFEKFVKDISVLKISTFRKPDEHLASHIAWVRKLGEPSEIERLSRHDDSIRKIVKKIVDVDLSSAPQITKFICWLEENRLYLFHNTQTRYLTGSLVQNHIHLLHAFKQLDSLDFVGISERLTEFIVYLFYGLGWEVDSIDIPKENQNLERFGFDMSNKEIKSAVTPLIEFDWIIYCRAREIFISRLHLMLAEFERNGPFGYSSVAIRSVNTRINNLLKKRKNRTFF